MGFGCQCAICHTKQYLNDYMQLFIHSSHRRKINKFINQPKCSMYMRNWKIKVKHASNILLEIWLLNYGQWLAKSVPVTDRKNKVLPVKQFIEKGELPFINGQHL